MNYELIESNNELLTTPCEPFDFANPPVDPEELAKDLVRIMYEKKGLGLAANQLGLPYRVFSMRGDPENFVCFNPKVITPSEEKVILEEGCLTYPNLLVKVKRSQHVRVRFTGPDGETYTKTFTGLTARIFQHEIDHLDGIRFFDRATRYHREQGFKKCKSLQKK